MKNPNLENRNPSGNGNERLLRFLQATPEQQAAIDRIMEGKMEHAPAPVTGPLLLGMGAGAKLLGVSRATFWRIIRAGRLTKVEVLPGSFRVRRADVEALACPLAGEIRNPKTESRGRPPEAEIRNPKPEGRGQLEEAAR